MLKATKTVYISVQSMRSRVKEMDDQKLFQQVLHPESRNRWAADRYFNIKKPADRLL